MTHHQTVALNTPSTGYENRRIVNGKTFHVQSDEVAVKSTVDDVWAEIAGNFVTGADIAKSLNAFHGLSGDLTEGLGAERYLNINFLGKTIEAKERIVDFRNCGTVREFTYDVYETKGAPVGIKTYNTWYVRQGPDGNVYIGSVFIFRANIAFLTGLIGTKLAQSKSLRTGLLTYKHYLETGYKVTARLIPRLRQVPSSMAAVHQSC